MAHRYVSFHLSDAWFPEHSTLHHEQIGAEDVRSLLGKGVISAVMPEYRGLVESLERTHHMSLPIVDVAPAVLLMPGDSLLVVAPNGLPLEWPYRPLSDAEARGIEWRFFLWSALPEGVVPQEKLARVHDPHDREGMLSQIDARLDRIFHEIDEIKEDTAVVPLSSTGESTRLAVILGALDRARISLTTASNNLATLYTRALQISDR